MAELNSCGTGPRCSQGPAWHVSMTSPEGQTGITVRKCEECMQQLLRTPAVMFMDRTVHLRRL